MTLTQWILRFIHPQAEAERVRMREALARAQAEAEDVTRTVNHDSERLTAWLAAHCKTEQK